MKTVIVNIKHESAYWFLKGILAANIRSDEGQRNNDSPYNLLKDEMIVSKGGIINQNEMICIQLNDSSHRSEKKLINHYTYEVQSYDSVSFKLVLCNFKITFQNEN